MYVARLSFRPRVHTIRHIANLKPRYGYKIRVFGSIYIADSKSKRLPLATQNCSEIKIPTCERHVIASLPLEMLDDMQNVVNLIPNYVTNALLRETIGKLNLGTAISACKVARCISNWRQSVANIQISYLHTLNKNTHDIVPKFIFETIKKNREKKFTSSEVRVSWQVCVGACEGVMLGESDGGQTVSRYWSGTSTIIALNIIRIQKQRRW